MKAIRSTNLPIRQMNFIKTTIATAAVITCCLGNTYPASAELSAREDRLFKAGYHYGYSYGLLVESCTMFMFGHVSRSELARSARYVRDNEDLTPALRNRIAKNFQEAAQEEKDFSVCNPTVQSILGSPASRPSNGYSRADNWF